nr:hypothetical protein [Lebetimonas sp. JS032]
MILNTPIDMHLHLREGKILKDVLPYTESQFAAAVVMPNLVPPVDNKERLLSYKEKILSSSKDFTPLMNVFMREYSEKDIKRIKRVYFCCKTLSRRNYN